MRPATDRVTIVFSSLRGRQGTSGVPVQTCTGRHTLDPQRSGHLQSSSGVLGRTQQYSRVAVAGPCSGLRSVWKPKPAPADRRRYSCSMSDGGIDAGERGGSEPPRHLMRPRIVVRGRPCASSAGRNTTRPTRARAPMCCAPLCADHGRKREPGAGHIRGSRFLLCAVSTSLLAPRQPTALTMPAKGPAAGDGASCSNDRAEPERRVVWCLTSTAPLRKPRRLGHRDDPADVLADHGYRCDIQKLEIRARPSPDLAPARPAHRGPPADRGAGLPRRASAPCI